MYIYSNIYCHRIEREKFYPGLGLEPGPPALCACSLTIELSRTSTDPWQNFSLVNDRAGSLVVSVTQSEGSVKNWENLAGPVFESWNLCFHFAHHMVRQPVHNPLLDTKISKTDCFRHKSFEERQGTRDRRFIRRFFKIVVIIYEVPQILNIAFHTFCNCGKYPVTWAPGAVQPLYKGKVSIYTPEYYRGISLLSVFCKIYCKILYERIIGVAWWLKLGCYSCLWATRIEPKSRSCIDTGVEHPLTSSCDGTGENAKLGKRV